MVGFICFARCFDLWSHIIMESWNLTIFGWYWDGSSDFPMVFVRLAWSLNQSLFGFCFVRLGWCVFALFFRTVRLDLELILHSLRSPKVRLLYLRSFRAKQMNLSVASQYIGLAPFLIIWPGLVFRVSPFRSFFPVIPGLPKEPASLRSIFFFVSFLGTPLYYHRPAPLSSPFLSFWAEISEFL